MAVARHPIQAHCESPHGRIVEVGRDLLAATRRSRYMTARGRYWRRASSTRTVITIAACSRSGAATELLSQGVTTIVVGQDGGSQLPIGKLWQTLDRHPVAVNVASYSGHNTIRSQVLGKNYRRVSTPQEIAKMAELLAADMRDGRSVFLPGSATTPASTPISANWSSWAR